MSQDNRKSIRRKVNEPARIVYDCGHVVSCQIRDISTTGAMIVMRDSRPLPPEFRLEDSSSTSRKIRLVWQAFSRAGVRFIDWARSQPRSGFGKRR